MELTLWFSWFFLSLNAGGVANILVYSCFESLVESCSTSTETFPVDVNRSDSFVKLSIYSSSGLVDLPACWWNNEMKPDRVSCCCFDCNQFSHFHPGPRNQY